MTRVRTSYANAWLSSSVVRALPTTVFPLMALTWLVAPPSVPASRMRWGAQVVDEGVFVAGRHRGVTDDVTALDVDRTAVRTPERAQVGEHVRGPVVREGAELSCEGAGAADHRGAVDRRRRAVGAAGEHAQVDSGVLRLRRVVGDGGARAEGEQRERGGCPGGGA